MASQLESMDLRAVTRAVQETAPRFGEVLAAYLFGSALDELRPDSDLDLAVVLREPSPEGLNLFDLEARLGEALPVLGQHPWHITALVKVDPRFALRAVREGKLLYEADEELHTDYLVNIALLNLDLEVPLKLFDAGRRREIGQ